MRARPAAAMKQTSMNGMAGDNNGSGHGVCVKTTRFLRFLLGCEVVAVVAMVAIVGSG